MAVTLLNPACGDCYKCGCAARITSRSDPFAGSALWECYRAATFSFGSPAISNTQGPPFTGWSVGSGLATYTPDGVAQRGFGLFFDVAAYTPPYHIIVEADLDATHPQTRFLIRGVLKLDTPTFADQFRCDISEVANTAFVLGSVVGSDSNPTQIDYEYPGGALTVKAVMEQTTTSTMRYWMYLDGTLGTQISFGGSPPSQGDVVATPGRYDAWCVGGTPVPSSSNVLSGIDWSIHSGAYSP